MHLIIAIMLMSDTVQPELLTWNLLTDCKVGVVSTV